MALLEIRVADARRTSDIDPNKSIVAETKQFIGNLAYGKTIKNKEKFVDTICNDEDAAAEINSPHFRQLNLIDEDLCEVVIMKKRIKTVDYGNEKTLNAVLKFGEKIYLKKKLKKSE